MSSYTAEQHQLYTLEAPGAVPLDLQRVKDVLKVDVNDDDEFIKSLMLTAVQHAEWYTGRDHRTNVWSLKSDCFGDELVIRKSLVESIDNVTVLVDGNPSVVSPTFYRLKQGHQWSWLQVVDTWPSSDEVDHAIEIQFTTSPYRWIDRAVIGMTRHVVSMYADRGDTKVEQSAKDSGANSFYSKIVRI